MIIIGMVYFLVKEGKVKEEHAIKKEDSGETKRPIPQSPLKKTKQQLKQHLMEQKVTFIIFVQIRNVPIIDLFMALVIGALHWLFLGSGQEINNGTRDNCCSDPYNCCREKLTSSMAHFAAVTMRVFGPL
jgi:hypothetical protein